MNENLNLIETLKDCPKGTKLYSTVFGDVELDHVSVAKYPIVIRLKVEEDYEYLTSEGKMYEEYDGECVLFPSKDQRDWSKFNPNKPKFSPKTLEAFDRVITKCGGYPWKCNIFSYYVERENKRIDCYCTSDDYIYDKCIPYNDDTKYLVGTTKEAPEYYRYWED